MKKYIDLHMHSLYSDDGEFTPTELVEKCYHHHIRIMAIADHNSVKAIPEGMAAAKERGMIYIPGIEIDCTFKDVNLHVLGYGIDYQQDIFTELEENVYRQEIACSMKKLELTNALGFHLVKEDLDCLSDNGVYTGEMFGEALLAKEEYQDVELLKPYRQGGERGDNPYVNFYWDYYAKGKPCYTEIHFPTLEETIDIIHKNGGVAVLAHPGNNLKGKFEYFDEMLPLGMDGVEVFSNYHSPEVVHYFYDKALEKNVLMTCGSDYHGKTKPSIEIGESRCEIDQEPIEKLLKEYHLI